VKSDLALMHQTALLPTAHASLKLLCVHGRACLVLQPDAQLADATAEGRVLACSHINFIAPVSAEVLLPLVAQENLMLKYAIIFAVISLIAGALGFGGIAAGSAGIAKILFGLFLILAIVFIVLAALGVGAARKALK
jgi:uncharacterized membrane protein YtjA (UPF0391 family)